MSPITWDAVGSRRYEAGVDHGVLYIPDVSGVYSNGVAWNGLTTVTESPSGAESNKQYADNIVYVNLQSAEEFGLTIEAFTYPDEFNQFDGNAVVNGVAYGQQARKGFGLSYRTGVGNDVLGTALGEKLHLVYGCLASPSEKAFSTVNDSPEAVAFSWEVSTTPAPFAAGKPVSLITIDSTKVDATKYQTLKDQLYGASGNPQLPTPDAVAAIFGAGQTSVRLTGNNAPTYNSSTHVVTLPSVTGVTWKYNGSTATPGAQPALTAGQTATIVGVPSSASYVITSDSDFQFDY